MTTYTTEMQRALDAQAVQVRTNISLGRVNNFAYQQAVALFRLAACVVDSTWARERLKPLTPDQRDGGARFEAAQNAGLDY